MSKPLARVLTLGLAPVLAPAAAAAQLMVNGPQGCALVAGLADGSVIVAPDQVHMVFDFHGIEAIEYRCAFEPAFDAPLAAGVIQTRIGHCKDPKRQGVIPGVFTVFDRGDGTMQLDTSYNSESIIFEICDSP